ncbi:MAG: SDR family NAD(P)-dependent oxidoreductase [Acidobacteriota bacterium]
MGRLENKRAVITGAGRGIGKAIARKFLQEGARVLVCDIVEDRIKSAVKDLSRDGEVYALAGDVSSATFCDDLVKESRQSLGGLDILVNNAGTGVFRPFLEHSEQDWDRTLDVNLKSMFLLGQRAARLMIEQGSGGAIVNMASTNGHMAEKELAAYNASKGGVILLTKTMAIELAGSNIRVNCVSPGFIRTELAQEAGGSDEFVHGYLSKIPLGRVGTPEEVANVFAFLASDEASFIIGESVIIDGGQTAEE